MEHFNNIYQEQAARKAESKQGVESKTVVLFK